MVWASGSPTADQTERSSGGVGSVSRWSTASVDSSSVGHCVTRCAGKGFATEIGAAGLEFGFEVLGAQEVVAYTEAHNHASRSVMERLDMEFVKIILAPGLVEGSDDVHDDAPFALYRIDRAARVAHGAAR